MKNLLRVLFLSAALAGAFVLARKQGLLRTAWHSVFPRTPLGEYRDPTLEEIDEYCSESLRFLDKKDYAGLEARATQALESRDRFANGSWKLFQFYSSFGLPDRSQESVWAARLQQINGWIAARPTSEHASIVLALFWIDYAWDARGGGYAQTVTAEGWRLFGARLATAQQVLQRAAVLCQRNPDYWRVLLIVARGLGWPPPRHNEIYAAGAAVEPEYWGLAVEHATWLMPRWGGKPGEMEAFAVQAASTAGEAGKEIYARIAAEMDSYYTDVSRQTKLEWLRVEAGFKALLAKYPDEPSILSHYAQLACRFGDTTTARKLLTQLDDRVDLRTWRTADLYRRHLQHATGKDTL
jgi:hypothetical protein